MPRRIAAPALHAFVAAVFAGAGSEPDEAETLASHLVASNLAGHDSHGVIRVPTYLGWVARGIIVPNRHARAVTDTGPILVVDGGSGYGQVIGREATALAADRARAHGLCAVAIRDATHLGRIGTYAEQLAEEGLVSVHFVNTSGFGMLVAPFGGTDRRLSTNPIAAGAPGPDGPIVLDMATSVSAEGKVQVARNKGVPLPPGVLLDKDGRPTTDPDDLYTTPPGTLVALGAHKGYGLAVLCEILAGSLGGGGSSNPAHPTAHRMANNMFSVVFDPAALGAEHLFAADVAGLVDWLRGARRADPDVPVLLPGEPERRSRQERLRDGIPLDAETVRQLDKAGQPLGIAFPTALEEAPA